MSTVPRHRTRYRFVGNHHGLLIWKADNPLMDWQAVAAWFYGSMRPEPQCRTCGGECTLCEGSGMVDDPTACGDPDHCSPVAPCPHGCPELH